MANWAEWQQQYGPQPAQYQKGNLSKYPTANVIRCQDCGKACTKARGDFVLTRKTVVCGKCYDETKHGEPSSVTNHGPTNAPDTCQHTRRTNSKRGTRIKPLDYCLDCWATLPRGGNV